MKKSKLNNVNKYTNGRIFALDGIKGISAILIACIYHLPTIGFPYTNGRPPISNILLDYIYKYGFLLVELFFCVSGYVTFLIYADKIDNGLSFSQFAKRRAIRILPLTIFTLITATVVNLLFKLNYGHVFWGPGEYTDTILSLALGFFGIQSLLPLGQSWNYPAWSISIFFLCWFIFYVIIKYTKKRDNLRIYGCISIILLGMTIQLNSFDHNVSLIFWSIDASRGYMSFFAGGTIYYIIKLLNDNIRKILSNLCIGWLIIAFGLNYIGVPWGNYYITFATFVFPPIVLIALENPVINRLLSMKCLTYLGKISFSIYLCNYSLEVILFMFNDLLKINGKIDGLLFMVLYIILHIIVATGIFKIFEEKIPKKLSGKA